MQLLRRFLAITTAALLVGAALAAAPASAASGNASSRTIDNEWATARFTVVRHGWAVSISASVTDDKADNCVYVKAELNVDNDPLDPDAHFGDNCNGKGTTVRDSITLAPGTLGGTGYSSIELWACESNRLSDDCTSVTIPVYQNNAVRPELAGRMSTIMTTTMADFQRRKAANAEPFDWSDNGCSSPIDISGTYNFNAACERHDFGYRNYGHGLTVNPTDGQRAAVDGQFHKDMDNWCASHNPSGGCYLASDTYYAAVRQKGGSSFF